MKKGIITVSEKEEKEVQRNRSVFQKNYLLHFEPDFAPSRKAALGRLELFVKDSVFSTKSWPAVFGADSNNESTVFFDSGENHLKSIGFTLKIEGNKKKRTIVLRKKTLDPLVLPQTLTCSKKNFVFREDQTFDFEKSTYSVSWKVKRKQGKGSLETFGELFDLFPGLIDQWPKVKPARALPLIPKRKLYSTKYTVATTDQSPVVRAKFAFSYSSEEDRIEEINCYDTSLSLVMSKPDGIDDSSWLSASRKLYEIFYGKLVKSPLVYKGPLLRASGDEL